MKIVKDTLMEAGKWSMSRLMVFMTFWANLAYAGWCVYKTAVFVDLPTNWLGFMTIMYGLQRGADYANKKVTTNADSSAPVG